MNSWYITKYNWLKRHPICIQGIVLTGTWLSFCVYVIYAGMTLYLVWIHRFSVLFLYLMVPALGFLMETALRAVLNKPRPYEILHIPPLKPKDTVGKSFPSRHSFSAAIISMACFMVYPILGSLMFMITILIGVCRVFIGVHWIRDVVAGIAFGWILGYIGFFLL